MNLGKNIKKLTTEFFVGVRITKDSFNKLNNIQIFSNAVSASLNCTPNLKKTLDIYDANSNYNVKGSILSNFVTAEKNFNIFPTPIFPVLKKIIDPEIHKKINIEIPININKNKNVDLPTNIIKEMFDPLENILKKDAAMSLVRIKRRKMRIHKYKKRHRKHKAIFMQLNQKKKMKKEKIFKEELKKILSEGLDFSAEKYVEENLKKMDWRPPITTARGRIAPDWVIEDELKIKKFKSAIEKRAKECAEKIKTKLS